MTTTTAPTHDSQQALGELIDRFDGHVIDVPGGRARIRLEVVDGKSWDLLIRGQRAWLEPPNASEEPDALLSADALTWEAIARDVRGGMEAFRAGRLKIRQNLHLGVGFLAATSGMTEPGRLRFESVKTPHGRISTAQAGTGEPLLALHGLGGTKASFLPTLAALADSYRVIAVDLPGFGESDKPIAAPYSAPWFARTMTGLLDALELPRAHLVGNSMGGRVSLELGLSAPDRVGRIVLLSPALAWLKDRRWALALKAVRPELGLVQIAPRGIVEGLVNRFVGGGGPPSRGAGGWVRAGVDEFLRSYLTPRGRAAFYAAARNIYLDEPYGNNGFWTRLAELAPETMFIWGRQDTLVPIAFMKHVERVLPAARHLELDCGHVPQLERPRETHAAMRDFLRK
jgi:pimeloyl-ACP methyl ester carboxylesterase